jgi:hypothetical protein
MTGNGARGPGGRWHDGDTRLGWAGRPGRQAWAVVALGVGVAAGAAALTLLSLLMRSVTAVGGSCAIGGSRVAVQPCPSGTGTALLCVVAGAPLCLVGTPGEPTGGRRRRCWAGRRCS